MLSLYSNVCPHGVRIIDHDECPKCVRLEAVKIGALAMAADVIYALTEPDDTATRAIMMTGIARYFSMKLNHPDLAARCLHSVLELLHDQLPCNREERLTAQQMFLTELSFKAHEPDEGARLVLVSKSW